MDAGNYSLYEDFVRRVMAKAPILYTRQLISAMVNEFAYSSMTENFVANVVLPEVQRRGYIMMSESGWVMTSMMYRMLSGDRFSVGYNLHGPYKLNKTIDVYSNDSESIIESSTPDVLVAKLPCGRDRLDEIDAMWIVCDNMPNSDDFILGATPPWDAMFTIPVDPAGEAKASGNLIQITRIHHATLSADIERLRSLPRVLAKSQQDMIQRLAIIDDEEDMKYIPYIGFRFICKIDFTSPTGYRIIGNRAPEHAWDECRTE